jgi:hypothetical protein
MAVGDITNTFNAIRKIKLLDTATTTNGQPTLVTQGVPGYGTSGGAQKGANFEAKPTREASIIIKATGTAPSITLRLWGWSAEAQDWVPLGPGGDTTKGTLNAGAAIGATRSTTTILHAEPVTLSGHFDRIYLEIVAASGSPTINAWLVVPRVDFA